MMQIRRRRFSRARLLTAILAFLVAPALSYADIVVTGSFGPLGSVGFNAGDPTVTIGAPSLPAANQGQLFQLDGFVNVAGQNLNNGSGFGTSAELSFGAPAGIGYNFSATQPTVHQLLLTYAFTNNTPAALPSFQFMSFADADSSAAVFDREFATVTGSLGTGFPDTRPSSYQVDDPTLGTIFTNLANGTLNNKDLSSLSSPINVSAALGFSLASLAPGYTATFQILLSDDGSSFGGINITQQNVDTTNYPTQITMSGRIVSVVPEPGSLTLLGVGSFFALVIRRVRNRKRLAPDEREFAEDRGYGTGSLFVLEPRL
jgi:hypothetical protein